MTLSLVAPPLAQQISDLVARLRASGLRAMAASSPRDGLYVAVIVPPARPTPGPVKVTGGQYHVTPTPAGLRVRWRPADGHPVTVGLVVTADRAPGLILDHLAGLIP